MDYKREGSVPWGWRSAACTAMGQIAVSDYDQDGEYMGTMFLDTPEEVDALFEDAAPLPEPVQAYIFVD